MTTDERLVALLDHLGVAAAHFATQIPADIAGLVLAQPDRIGGLVLCVPTRLDPAPFVGVAERLMMISGDKGLTVEATERAAHRLPRAARHVLANYDAAGWSDVIAERGADVVDAVTGFLHREPVGRQASAGVAPGTAREGQHAGLTWRIEGDGPVLVLMPFFLAASQWQPGIAGLSQRFTVVQLGGPHVGGVAALEDRAQAYTYQTMFRTLVDLLAVPDAGRVLDVGCGSGALDRLLARRLGSGARIDAVDLNPFFLREARALAEADGVADSIHFAEASAVSLPFADATFDAVFSVTVLEECDADRAIAEMVRVVRPGGRVGIVVRAIDIAQWWNLDLSAELGAKVAVPPQSVGVGGVADRSLYRRMRQKGLVDLVAFPSLVTLDRPDGPIWRYREDHVRAQLSPAEAAQWQAARDDALADGLLMTANAVHAAVATKPARA